MKNYKTCFNQKLHVNNRLLPIMREANIVNFMLWWNDELITFDKGSYRLANNPSVTFFNNLAHDHSGKAFTDTLNTLDFVTDIIFHGGFRKATITMSYFLRSNKDKLEEESHMLYKRGTHSKLKNPLEDGLNTFDLNSLYNYDKEQYNKWIFGYLHNERKIDRYLIAELLSRKLISFDTEGKNILFITYNANNEIVSIEKKGTFKGKKYAQVHSKESNTPFIYIKEDTDSSDIDILYIFESSIDLLSYIIIYQADNSAVYISTRGTSKMGCIDSILNTYPYVETICVCADNDSAGAKMYNDISIKYCEYEIIPTFSPCKKDWNEYLVSHL